MRIAVLISLLLISGFLSGQERKATIFGFPVLYRTPENGFTVGGAVASSFFLSRSDTVSPPALLSLSASVSEGGQYQVYLPFQTFFKQRHWFVQAEVAYSSLERRFYADPASDHYLKNTFDQLKLRLGTMRLVKAQWYVGVRYWYEANAFDVDGFEQTQHFRVHAPAIMITRDRRKEIFFPKSSSWFEMFWQSNTGDLRFNRIRADYRRYDSTKSKRLVFASQLFAEYADKQLPFLTSPSISGPRKLRGWYENQLYGQTAAYIQSEIRMLVWRRIGISAFAGWGVVQSPVSTSIFIGRVGYGGGFRFLADRKKGIYLRADLAGGSGMPYAYLTIGESF